MNRTNMDYLSMRGVRGNLVRLAGISENVDGNLTFSTFNPFQGTKGSIVHKTLPGDELGVLDYPFPPHQLYGLNPPKLLTTCILVEDVFDLLSPGFWGRGFAMGYKGLSSELERWLIKLGLAKIIVWFGPDSVVVMNALVRRLRSHPRPEGKSSYPPLIVVGACGWAFDRRDPCEYSDREAYKLFTACEATGSSMPPKPQ